MIDFALKRHLSAVRLGGSVSEREKTMSTRLFLNLQGGLALSGVSRKLGKQATFSKETSLSFDGVGGGYFPHEVSIRRRGRKG